MFSATPTPLKLEPAAALSPHKTNRVQLYSRDEIETVDRRVAGAVRVPVSDQLHAPTLHIQHAAPLPPNYITELWVYYHTVQIRRRR